MTELLPIQASRAIIHVTGLPGLQVAHAAADENSDALVLRCLLEAVQLGCKGPADEPLKRFVGGNNELSAIPSRPTQSRMVRGSDATTGQPARDMKLTFSNIENHIDGDYAWAICDVEAEVRMSESHESIRSRGRETFVFRRERGDWRPIYARSSPAWVKTD